jgi:hypothetical protein
MDINALKEEAALAADQIDIQWGKLENPTYRKDFERTLIKASAYVPELEGLYSKLTSGESVLFPDEQSPLGYDDLEKYSKLVEEELFNGYVLEALYKKYRAVEDVIQAAIDNPE